VLEFLALNPIARAVFLAALFAIVVFVALQVINAIYRRADIRADLDLIAEQGAKISGERLREVKESAWSKIADRIEKAGLSLADTQGDELRRKLIAAGYESPSAPRIFTLVRIIMIFALPGFMLLAFYLGGQELSLFKLYAAVAIFALLGLYLPNIFVTAKADRRREEIVNGFPDCLDLILVCVEAGLGLEAAMDRVAREMAVSHPLVSQILSTATLQMRAGADRETALRKMGELSGVEEIRSFGTLLIQSDKLGTSISATLRVYAAEMREKRRLRAEERAHRLPVLISIPLVACMLPTMVSVLMLPGVVRVVRQLLPAFAGG